MTERAASSASMVSDLPRRRRAWRLGRSTSITVTSRAARKRASPAAPAAGTLHADRGQLPVRAQEAQQRLEAGGGGGELGGGQHPTQRITGSGDVDVLVRVDSADHRPWWPFGPLEVLVDPTSCHPRHCRSFAVQPTGEGAARTAGTADRTLSGPGCASSSEVTPPDRSCREHRSRHSRPVIFQTASRASANVGVRPPRTPVPVTRSLPLLTPATAGPFHQCTSRTSLGRRSLVSVDVGAADGADAGPRGQ